MVLDQARTVSWAWQRRGRPREHPWRALPTTPLPLRGASGSQRYSQTHAGIGRQHVDVVLTQRVDDDGFAPVHQVSRKLEHLWAEGAGRPGPTG